jgi:hypothetical protein
MDDLLRSTIFYTAALSILIAIAALVHPLPTFIYRTRFRALLAIVVCGAVIAILSTTTPASATVTGSKSELDRFAPKYHFHEVHETRIAAPPDRVYAAIKSVTPDEIALFQTFTWIRRFGRALPAGVLDAPGGRSILDTAIRGGFLLLSEEVNKEIVFGMLVVRPPDVSIPEHPTPDAFRLLDRAGLAKATMNFRIEPTGAKSSRLVTETRVFATDDGALQRFTPYWLAIYPGSAILRVTWLRAIKTRAESTNAF